MRRLEIFLDSPVAVCFGISCLSLIVETIRLSETGPGGGSGRPQHNLLASPHLSLPALLLASCLAALSKKSPALPISALPLSFLYVRSQTVVLKICISMSETPIPWKLTVFGDRVFMR